MSTPFVQHTFVCKVLGEKVVLQLAPCRDDIQQSDSAVAALDLISDHLLQSQAKLRFLVDAELE